MGRALIIILCSLFFTLTPTGHIEGTEEKSYSWDAFITQYKWLIQDGKYELADRMLNSRLPDLKQYMETLSPRHEEVWHQLNDSMKDDPAHNRESSQRFLAFIEIVTSNEPQTQLTQKIEYLSSSIQNVHIPPEELTRSWQRIRPGVMIFYEEEKVEAVDKSMNKLVYEDTLAQRKQILNNLEPMVPQKDTEPVEALLWTVLIIGGTIMVTLSYVAYRKFTVRSKNRHSIRSENS